ncbi:MAG TPA: heparan-alpha-glucosaminide N-acetyltransferase domain-containing protein [Motilibacterales bacterium]|nr:heparan-alpha-glucosaminide N-acetyltransferase domain-containing protein [Motilibacterales bacterium]
MTRVAPADPGAALSDGRRRLAGVDAARGLALIGMFSVHLFRMDYGPDAPLARELASGRSAALFAVLAGVGIALATGGAQPWRGRSLQRARRAVAARAAVVAAIGLTLAVTDATILIILPYYAALFLLAIPVLGWPARRLAVLAAVAAVTTPVVSHLLRQGADVAIEGNPTWSDLLTGPAQAARVLLLTGTYPVLTWSTYLFAGLAIGRLALGRPRVAGQLVLAGAGLALAGWAVGWATLALVGRPTVASALPRGGVPEAYLDSMSLHWFFGTPPTTQWWWLGIRAPHIGTTPDLVHTTGTALVVLGVCLLMAPRVGRWARPLVAAGSMTLSLYTVHVLAFRGLSLVAEDAPRVAALPATWVWLAHVGVALVVATAWGSPARRGPLESLSALAARRAAGAR